MATQQIRNAKGQLIGTITDTAGGQQAARDAQGKYQGSYDPRSNVTRNAAGRVVGTGNLLASLIH
ncbi:MAG: hypothetical protein VX738_15370 [Planctomycetota bacterium]|nr:hypothetical protein [Planctomycetota bacterium]